MTEVSVVGSGINVLGQQVHNLKENKNHLLCRIERRPGEKYFRILKVNKSHSDAAVCTCMPSLVVTLFQCLMVLVSWLGSFLQNLADIFKRMIHCSTKIWCRKMIS